MGIKEVVRDIRTGSPDFLPAKRFAGVTVRSSTAIVASTSPV
jgi:hypothetical protein